MIECHFHCPRYWTGLSILVRTLLFFFFLFFFQSSSAWFPKAFYPRFFFFLSNSALASFDELVVYSGSPHFHPRISTKSPHDPECRISGNRKCKYRWKTYIEQMAYQYRFSTHWHKAIHAMPEQVWPPKSGSCAWTQHSSLCTSTCMVTLQYMDMTSSQCDYIKQYVKRALKCSFGQKNHHGNNSVLSCSIIISRDGDCAGHNLSEWVYRLCIYWVLWGVIWLGSHIGPLDCKATGSDN